MFPSGVTFVLLEVVVRETTVQRLHDAVTLDLRYYAGSRHRLERLVRLRDTVGGNRAPHQRKVIAYGALAALVDAGKGIPKRLHVNRLDTESVNKTGVHK